jgi:putative phage-type endonuclease
MNRDEFLADRRSGIGGSDAAAVLGLSKWKTPFAVYQEKVGEILETTENEAMLWGKALEPVIRQQYAERTGRAVLVPDGMLTHPKHSFMLANLDGFTDDKRIVEIKTARTADEWGEPGTDEVPQAYLIQVQHYMAVTGFPVADVAVLIGGQDFRLYEVPADAELQEMMIEGEAEFWKRVVDRNPPDATSFADVVARYGRTSNGMVIEASGSIVKAVSDITIIKGADEGAGSAR